MGGAEVEPLLGQQQLSESAPRRAPGAQATEQIDGHMTDGGHSHSCREGLVFIGRYPVTGLGGRAAAAAATVADAP